MDAFRFAVDEAELERLALGEAGELEADDGAAVGEAGFVVNVGGVPGFPGGAAYFQHTAVKVGHLHLRHAVGGRAVPTVADGLGTVAGFLALEGVVEDQRAVGPEPDGVIGGTGGFRGGLRSFGGKETGAERATERGKNRAQGK